MLRQMMSNRMQLEAMQSTHAVLVETRDKLQVISPAFARGVAPFAPPWPWLPSSPPPSVVPWQRSIALTLPSVAEHGHASEDVHAIAVPVE